MLKLKTFAYSLEGIDIWNKHKLGYLFSDNIFDLTIIQDHFITECLFIESVLLKKDNLLSRRMYDSNFSMSESDIESYIGDILKTRMDNNLIFNKDISFVEKPIVSKMEKTGLDLRRNAGVE